MAGIEWFGKGFSLCFAAGDDWRAWSQRLAVCLMVQAAAESVGGEF